MNRNRNPRYMSNENIFLWHFALYKIKKYTISINWWAELSRKGFNLRLLASGDRIKFGNEKAGTIMKCKLLVIYFMFFSSSFSHVFGNIKDEMKLSSSHAHLALQQKNPVHKYTLKNGMTILVRVVKTVPKVSIQLWYGVGSRDEKEKERGIAHLIEHMIFKGTSKLSESDINVVTHKLSGECNAFTSYDYTGYLFNMPSHTWHEVLPVMADCMTNCRFDEQMLNSEMKAVIQELKMYRDQYTSSLVDKMITAIFSGHPYHHPIIGYKQDLWSVSSDDLRAFYKKHYLPNNATLVVVGDVDPEDVYKQAKECFSSIKPNDEYERKAYYLDEDIVSKTITLHRDVQQPTVLYAFKIPGMIHAIDHIYELLSWIIGRGKDSRLYKKLVNESQLVTSVSANSEELFEHGLFFISCEPKKIGDLHQIEAIIAQELADIATNGVSDRELERAIKQTQMGVYASLEDIEHQAYEIGKYYLATGDENYLVNYLNQPHDELHAGLKQAVKDYLRMAVMHRGVVSPIAEVEKPVWELLQKQSDEMDNAILEARERTTPIEPPSYANDLELQDEKPFDFPKPQRISLKNGLKALYYHTANVPKIDVVLSLKAKHYFDPEDKQGLARFVSSMLSEGTKKHTAQELASEIESRGIKFQATAGSIAMSMLSQDFEFGLSMLHELLTQAIFEDKSIEKIRARLQASLRNFWDDPNSFAGQLIRQEIYKEHPYSKNMYGTAESLVSITRQDLLDYYAAYFSPDGAKIAIVGDLSGYDIPVMLDNTLGKWQGKEVKDIAFPAIEQTRGQLIDYPMSRDQVVLGFAGKSIDRKHPDYDKILLFDQIFGGTSMMSMSSKLFQLREESGLFYTIRGSLLANTDEQPGMVTVRTIVSVDRLKEAEEKIKETIRKAPESITDEELEEAKHAIASSLVSYFASNDSIAGAFIFLEKYNLPDDYFDTRAQVINKISIDDIKKAVNKILDVDTLIELRIGRIQDFTQS